MLWPGVRGWRVGGGERSGAKRIRRRSAASSRNFGRPSFESSHALWYHGRIRTHWRKAACQAMLPPSQESVPPHRGTDEATNASAGAGPGPARGSRRNEPDHRYCGSWARALCRGCRLAGRNGEGIRAGGRGEGSRAVEILRADLRRLQDPDLQLHLSSRRQSRAGGRSHAGHLPEGVQGAAQDGR